MRENTEGEWRPPGQVEEFRLERLLGAGAYGQVWLAHDTLLDRAVALKIASSGVLDEARVRFRMEARAVARLEHPNLVRLHHFGEVAERPFIVTELLSGQSLAELDLPVEPRRVLGIAVDLARGLSAAHRAGVLHRDVKPANAFLCSDGTAKLLDFGLARLGGASASPIDVALTVRPVSSFSAELAPTQPGYASDDDSAGTPRYMAPETWRGQPPTTRTDVYSLGALLFELLGGGPPCDADTLPELHRQVLAGSFGDLAALAPSAPPPLVDIVMRCLRLDPNERPSSEELCNRLELLATRDAEGGGAPDDPSTSPYRGLLAFGPPHRTAFFGREAETAEVVAELRTHPFVLVVGPSGTGKSSLVRAAVVPRVEAGDARRALVMIPGARPLEALARVAAPVLGAADPPEVEARIAASPAWLAQELRAKRARVVLVVDQLEEIWTLAPERDRAVFIAVLGALVDTGPAARIIATLRADFLPRLGELGKAQAHALRAAVFLGSLTREGLRRAVVEPARRRGVTMEPALVDRLVEGGEAGSLPLLEFALAALWERRDRSAATLGVSALDGLGGVAGALAAHADQALARMPPAQREAARGLLLALVTVERARARREERDLADAGGPEAHAALEALVEARLVVASAGEDGTAYEVAHEALLSGWPALRGWLDEEAATRETATRVRRAAAEWERLARSEEALLGERQLAELDVLAGRPLEPPCAGFVEASRAAVRRVRWRRRLLVVGIPLVLLAVGATAARVSLSRRRAMMAHAIAEAYARGAEADERTRAAGDARTQALALFEKDDLGPAEGAWRRALALEEDADRARRDGSSALDRALSIDPTDPEARALAADVTFAGLLAAERLHRHALFRELRARLGMYDDGSRAARLLAPARVRVETDPPDATLTLARYREDAAGRLVETDRAPLASGSARDFEPGSYLIVAEHPDRAVTRYPFAVRRGEERDLRIALPHAADVPAGMLYIPAGRFLYGSAEDEATRGFLMHQPIHEVELGAFFIGRTEVTNDEFLTFLRALPEEARKERSLGDLLLSPDGRGLLRARGVTLAEGEPYCNDVQPCIDWSRLPVNGASHDDGVRYAEWLARSGRVAEAHLCTDREWERAARGADDRRYTNGNADLGPDDACTLATYAFDVHRARPCAAGTHPASRSPFGADDMVGSEWEWTSTVPDVAQSRGWVTRGASWTDQGMLLALCNRGFLAGGGNYQAYGLRICAGAR